MTPTNPLNPQGQNVHEQRGCCPEQLPIAFNGPNALHTNDVKCSHEQEIYNLSV